MAGDLTTPPPAGDSGSLPDISREHVLAGELHVTFSPDFTPELPREHASTAFRILRTLGEGGMGVVYLAEQERPRRTVALKVLKNLLANTHAARRFDREVAILARLRHPGIAHLYSIGASPDPQTGGRVPFMVMEYIEGLPITQFALERRLSVPDRIRLLLKVCDALEYAHEEGVVHRDLKPSNVLVDNASEPRILDFGLASVRGWADTARTLTAPGELLGTLDFMSPEQALGRLDEVDRRSDVYALGVMLYELLAGRRPWALAAAPLPEAVRTIRDEDPPPLSSSNRSLGGDLENIVQMALAKEKDRRYPTAMAFAQDLRRYLTNEPVRARRPSTVYVTAKFVRRHRLMMAAAGIVIAGLSLALAITWRAAVDARSNSRALAVNLAFVHVAGARAQIGLGDYGEAWTRLQSAAAEFRALDEPTTPADCAMLELSMLSATPVRDLTPPITGACKVALFKKKFIAIGDNRGAVELHDFVTNRVLARWNSGNAVNALQFSPDGKRLLTYTIGTLKIFDTGSFQQLLKRAPYSVMVPTMSNDGFAYYENASQVRVEYFDDSQRSWTFPCRGVPRALALVEDNLFCVDADWGVYAASHGAFVFQLGKLDIGAGSPSVEFSESARRVMTVGRETMVFDTQTCQPLFKAPLTSLTRTNGFLGPEEFFLEDPAAPVVTVYDRDCKPRIRVPKMTLASAAMSAEWAVVASPKQPVRLWYIGGSPALTSTREFMTGMTDAVLSPSGATMFAINPSNDWFVWHDACGLRRLFERDLGTVSNLRFSSNMRHMAGRLNSFFLDVWQLPSLAPEAHFSFQGSVGDFALTPDGNLVLANLMTEKAIHYARRSSSGWSQGILKTAFQPDNLVAGHRWNLFVVFSSGASAEIWDCTQWPPATKPLEEFTHQSRAAFADDDRRILMWSGDSTISVWDTHTARKLDGFSLSGNCLSVATGRGNLIAASDANYLSFFDLARGELLARFRSPIPNAKLSMNNNGSRLLVIPPGNSPFGSKLESCLVDLSVFPALCAGVPDLSGTPAELRTADLRWFIAAGLGDAFDISLPDLEAFPGPLTPHEFALAWKGGPSPRLPALVPSLPMADSEKELTFSVLQKQLHK